MFRARLRLQPCNFNPRSPHGERPRSSHPRRRTHPISTHAPRTGSDFRPSMRSRAFWYFNPRSPHGERRSHQRPPAAGGRRFQPTLPARGATHQRAAPAAGGGDFNPRSPHGERRLGRESVRAFRLHFNPRSPHGERLNPPDEGPVARAISTHAPRTGSDLCRAPASFARPNFNPRSPHGERRRRRKKQV